MSNNQSESERTVTVRWDDPRKLGEAARGLTGMEFLQKIVAGELPPPPMAALLKFELVELSEGHAIFAVEPKEYHYNPLGTVHGGLAATLLDSAMGCAVHTTLEPGWAYGSLDLSARFVRTITPDTGRIVGEGVVVHRGGRTATMEGKVWAEESGKLLAHGTGSALLFPLAVSE